MFFCLRSGDQRDQRDQRSPVTQEVLQQLGVQWLGKNFIAGMEQKRK